MAVPTGVSVTNLGDYWPTFNATRVAESGKLFSMQWDIASDSGFTTVLFTVNNTTQSASAGAVSQQFSNASRTAVIPAGTYYVRARQMEDGVTPHAWSGTVTITSTVVPPTFSAASINSPAGTVGSNTPVLSVDFLGDQTMSNYQRKLIPVVQLAAAADFTGTTYTFDVGTTLKHSPSPVRVAFLGIATTVPSGTYYVRMRARDEVGAYSSYVAGANTTLVVSASASNLSPNATVIPYVTALQLNWTYVDLVVGSDQTAYRVIVYRSDTSAVVYDSGKIASSVKSATFAPAVGLKEISLYWTVQVWNTQDYAGVVSGSASFTLTEPAGLTITAPSGATVDTGQPTFNWSVGGVNPLATWSLLLRRVSDNVVIWSASGGVGDYPVTPQYNILTNGTAYVVYLTVISTSGETSSANKTFSASYNPPISPTFSVDGSGYDSLGYVDINWTSATPDASFHHWTVYRRTLDDDSWTPIFTTEEVGTRHYHDWQAGTGITYEYVVSQTALIVDALQESALVSLSAYFTPSIGGSWLIDPDNFDNNVRLYVTSDSFSVEREEAVLVILGRGRTKEYGTTMGLVLDLTIQIRGEDAKVNFDKIQAIWNLRKDLIYRSPFGEIRQVALSDFSGSHLAGTGTTEMFDVSLKLEEVF